MDNELMKVGVFRTGEGAQDFYRATLPIQTAIKNKEIESSEIWMGNILYEAQYRNDEFIKTMTQDIYLIQRLGTKHFMDKVRSFIKDSNLKTKIVLDHDDDVFNVSPLSQHYAKYGSKECKIFHEGKLVHEWKNGVNMDLKENLRILDQFKFTLEMADMVSVTTEGLRESFAPYNENIRVLPNCIDLSQWNRLDVKRRNPDEIRICWYGGNSHWEDLFLIKDALIEIGRKYKNVRIIMVGYKPQKMDDDFYADQVRFYPWVEMAAHPYRLAALDIDIGVVPLKETPFNLAKSPIKWVEFSALKIPSVTSFCGPYKEIAAINSESGVFVEGKDTELWVNELSTLIESETLRKTYGERARHVVRDHFNIETQYKRWIDVYKEALNGQPIQSIAS